MTRAQLLHAIRAAANVSGDDELLVFGSQAIHGSELEPPDELTTSIEVDIQPKNRPETTVRIDGALGELSPFHRSFGFYVHGVEIEAATLPPGWSDRLVPLFDEQETGGRTGWCLELHDLAASKLAAFRDKDRDYVRVLLSHALVNPIILQVRLESLPIAADMRERLIRWLRMTVSDLTDG